MRPRLPASAGLLVVGVLFLQAVSPALLPDVAPVSQVGTVVGGERLGSRRLQIDLAPGVPLPPVPPASAWLIADLDSRQVLAARNVHLALAPASTMKIFTALALAPRLDPDEVYTAQDSDAAVDGTKVGLVPGSRYTVDQLLHGMLMGSGNDCAHALGNLAGGQRPAIARMKEVADRLGAFDTVPRTTSGLDAPGQVSSAYDLALAGTAALQDPQLTKIMQTAGYRFPAAGKSLGPGRKHFATQNHNHLLGNLPGATGVKNGYTVAARGSFVGSATRSGQSYLVVLVRAEGSTWRASADLLDWAFRHGSQAKPVGTLVLPGTTRVLAASTGGTGTTAGRSHLSGAQLDVAAGGPGGAVGSLKDRLDRAGLDGTMILLTTGACLAVAVPAGLLRLYLARRRRADRRRADRRRADRRRAGQRRVGVVRSR